MLWINNFFLNCRDHKQSVFRQQAKVVQRVYFPLGQQGAVWTHRCCTAVSAPLHSPKKKKTLLSTKGGKYYIIKSAAVT